MGRGVEIGFRKIKRLALITVVFLISAETGLSSEDARPLCASSSYYPASSVSLYDQVVAFSKTRIDTACGRPVALIVPNEAYIYVGSLLGKAYNSVSKHNFSRIVIFGYDESANPVSIYSGPGLSTPMGGNPVDNDFCRELKRISPVQIHEMGADRYLPVSIEIQLPFLQYHHSQVPIVPIGINGIGVEIAEELGTAIATLSGDSAVLYVAASNLSSSFDIETCESNDNNFLQLLLASQIEKAIDKLKTGEIQAESRGALIAVLSASAKMQGNTCTILRYENTGRLTGDHQHVCGYLAAVITTGSDTSEVTEIVDLENGKKLLELARTTIEIEAGKLSKVVARSEIPADIDFDGVHIDIVGGEREYGMGMIRPDESLYETVKKVALVSAFADPRFKSIGFKDVDEILLKLYIIYNLERLTDIEDFVPGKHGVLIARGTSSAKVFPDEMDLSLSREDILGRVSLKAGLFSDSWKRSDTEIWIFNVQVFEEER